MPSSLAALAIFAAFVLPGATFVWAFERVVGPWGVGLSDRILRFLGVSALIYAIYLPLGYFVWRWKLAELTAGHPLRWAEKQARAAEGFPWWLYFAPLLYVGVPGIAGTLAARCVRSRNAFFARLGTILAGPYPAPRAWDDVFVERPYGLVRGRLTDGEWIGGLFASRSYASGFPHSQDLFLEETYEIDDEGTFERDENGYPVSKGSGLLINFAELQFLETFFTETADE